MTGRGTTRVRRWPAEVSRRSWLVCALGAALLIAIPTAVAVARTGESYRASVEIYPLRVGGLPRPRNPSAYLRSLMHTSFVTGNIGAAVHFTVGVGTLTRRVTFRPVGSRVRMTVRSDSPAHARRLASALVVVVWRRRGLAVAAVQQGKAEALATLKKLYRVVATPATLKAWRREVRRLRIYWGRPTPRLAGGPVHSPPLRTRFERKLDALPGDLPPGVTPWLAAASSSIVAALYCAAVLAFSRRRRLARSRLA